MPVQIESHRLHIQVRHVQHLGQKYKRKTLEKWSKYGKKWEGTKAFRSNELQPNNENIPGATKIYVDREYTRIPLPNIFPRASSYSFSKN